MRCERELLGGWTFSMARLPFPAPRGSGGDILRKTDGVLGAGGDAKAAGVALIGAHRESLFVAVERGFQAAHEGEFAALLLRQLGDLEDAVGADADAILLALAAVAVDHRRDDAGRLLAGGRVRHLTSMVRRSRTSREACASPGTIRRNPSNNLPSCI